MEVEVQISERYIILLCPHWDLARKQVPLKKIPPLE